MENNRFNLKKRWFSGQSRLESVTDVNFYDDTHLIVANRADCILYYIEFDYVKKTFKVIDSLCLSVNKKEQYITLFTINNKKIYFTTLTKRLSIVDIIDDKLKIIDTLVVDDPGVFHGITFHPQNDDIIYLTTASKIYNNLMIYDIVKKKVIKSLSLPKLEKVMLKQVKFLDSDHIVVCGCLAGVSVTNHNISYDAYIGIYNVHTLECIDTLKIDTSQCDDMFIYDNKIHLTHQGAESYGKILVFSYENMKLSQIKEKQVYGFPHGIDFRNNMIACTSMCNSSVSLFPYDI
jgi:hypothetical protein